MDNLNEQNRLKMDNLNEQNRLKILVSNNQNYWLEYLKGNILEQTDLDF